MVKTCKVCGLEKSVSDFGFTNKEKTQLDPRCKECKRDYKKELRRTRRDKGLCHKCGKKLTDRKICDKCFNVSKDRRNAFKKRAISYLGGECVRCGIITKKDFVIYDFHHIDSETKEATIGSMISDYKGYGKATDKAWEKLKKELDKCVLMCSNCHRIFHFNGESLDELQKCKG